MNKCCGSSTTQQSVLLERLALRTSPKRISKLSIVSSCCPLKKNFKEVPFNPQLLAYNNLSQICPQWNNVFSTLNSKLSIFLGYQNLSRLQICSQSMKLSNNKPKRLIVSSKQSKRKNKLSKP
jgi:hypothetical protein